MPVRNAGRPEVRARGSGELRPLQQWKQSLPRPPCLLARVRPQAPLQRALPKSLRGPDPPAVLMQTFQAQVLTKVPRAKERKVQASPSSCLPLGALTEIL